MSLPAQPRRPSVRSSLRRTVSRLARRAARADAIEARAVIALRFTLPG